MRVLSASDFKARCLGLLDEVAATGEPITITKRGKVVARLVSVRDAANQLPQLALLGTVTIEGDLLEPIPGEEWSADAEHLD